MASILPIPSGVVPSGVLLSFDGIYGVETYSAYPKKWSLMSLRWENHGKSFNIPSDYLT